MNSPAIGTEGLCRVYKIRGNRKEKKPIKDRVALHDVNLKVGRGELFGLLGPNGAGKTSGYLMPMTCWLELMRRALLGSNLSAFPTLVSYSNAGSSPGSCFDYSAEWRAIGD